MNIILLGYGKMGKMVEQAAMRHQINIVSVFDADNKPDLSSHKNELQKADVFIDFSQPDAVPDNVRLCATLKKNLVIGTTGWYQNIEDIKNIVIESGIGVIWGPNFSIGMNLCFSILEQVSQMVSVFENYSPYITESHHHFKKDEPSGTAIRLREIVQRNYPGIHLPVSALRAGFIPGTHTIGFDSEFDNIELTHTARTREGFAEGAVIAAQLIADKTGFLEFSEVLKQILMNKKGV